MVRCAHKLPTVLHLVVLLATIGTWDSAGATPVYQPETIEVLVKAAVDLQSPGFPSCCDDKYIFYRLLCVPDYPGQPCYLRMVFADVDMTAGSSIKIYEDRVLIESISQVGPVHKDTWYRPVVASNTGELILQVRLVASGGPKQHIGFRANITKAEVPGLQNWPDRPITTECPEAPPVQHGSVRMRMFSREDRIHDCVWVIRGPQNCAVYVAVSNNTDSVRHHVQIGLDTSAAAPRSYHVYSASSRLYVRVRKPVHAGHFEMYYGCWTDHYEKSSASQECLSRSISLYGGFECPTGICVPGTARCNGVNECPDGDADETGCFNGQTPAVTVTSSWPAAVDKGVSPAGPHVYPYTTPPVNETLDQIVECFGSVWPDERLMYLFFSLPIVLLLFVAGVCYFCIRKKARLRRSHLGVPTEGDPPPTYQISIQHVKPELDLLASLPSYAEVCGPSDAPPKYAPRDLTPVHQSSKETQEAYRPSVRTAQGQSDGGSQA